MNKAVKIAIVPSNFRKDWLCLFSLTFPVLKDLNVNYEVVVTKHPTVDQKLVLKDLEDCGGSHASFYNGMTSKAVAESDIVIVGVSTLVIDAIMAGKYVIICKSPNDIWYGIDELDISESGFRTGIYIVNNPNEMAQSIRDYEAVIAHVNEAERAVIISHFLENKGRDVVERFWSEIKDS